MNCLALLDSGNYAIFISNKLRKIGIDSEIIPTPCKIAENGCGYCLKFNCEHKDLILHHANQNNIKIDEIYKINTDNKNKYGKIDF